MTADQLQLQIVDPLCDAYLAVLLSDPFEGSVQVGQAARVGYVGAQELQVE